MSKPNLYRVVYMKICIIFKFYGKFEYIEQYNDFHSLLEFLPYTNEIEDLNEVMKMVRQMYDFLVMLYYTTEKLNKYKYDRFSIAVESVPEFYENSFEEVMKLLGEYSYNQNLPEFIPISVFPAGMIKTGYSNRSTYKKILDSLGSVFA